jgi:hypothetical protein
MAKKMKNAITDRATSEPLPPKISITIPDRVLRELNIIDTIFKAQYLKCDPTEPFPYLLDKTGRSGIDGKYMISVFLLSDVELFNLQLYKKEFTARFESTTNLSLLRNQLLEIREKAIEIKEYYNRYLTKGNNIVDEFISKNKSLDNLQHFHERIDFLESHRSIATISNYHIMEIYLGVDLHGKNGFIGDRDKYNFNYLSDNSQLASICQRIVDFIDKFELEHQNHGLSINKKKNMPKYFETEIRESFKKKYLKIFLQHGLDHEAVSAHLNKLHSVNKANVTVQQSGKVDLTVYPAKAYDILETQEEVELTLDNYFKGNNVDPQFIEEPVSAVSEKAYYQVIDYMLTLGKNLESSKRLNEKMGEEWYRDYFIPYLNAISKKHSATGESFHSKGKTDILFLNNEGEPVLIAECKLWKGEKLLLEAIDQLLNNYVNWRDEKIALVVFNRDVKKFSDVIDTATKAIEGHKLCLKALGKRKDTSYSYLFRNPDDERRTIKLELVLFHVG